MPKPLNIPATEYTLAVQYDAENRVLHFEGESYPENVSTFFGPLMKWLKDFLDEKPAFTVRFRLLYFNTSSSKAILDLLDVLEAYYCNGGEVKIIWEYSTGVEMMREAGEEFVEDFTLPFVLVAV